jgi:hypothetical protein
MVPVSHGDAHASSPNASLLSPLDPYFSIIHTRQPHGLPCLFHYTHTTSGGAFDDNFRFTESQHLDSKLSAGVLLLWFTSVNHCCVTILCCRNAVQTTSRGFYSIVTQRSTPRDKEIPGSPGSAAPDGVLQDYDNSISVSHMGRITVCYAWTGIFSRFPCLWDSFAEVDHIIPAR